MGRSVEGRYHTSAAVALAVILQSHNTGALSTGGPYHRVQSHTIGASPPTDDEEIHHILWSVYILDRTWSVATGSQLGAPLAINCGTPRPLAINTLQNDAFVQADPSTADNALIREHINCLLALSVLCLFYARKRPPIRARFEDDFALLRAESSLRREDDSSVLLVHTLAHAATAQLYRGCHEPQTLAGQKALRLRSYPRCASRYYGVISLAYLRVSLSVGNLIVIDSHPYWLSC
ncbi:uncharacterized protein B0H18DRAFT_1000945 [Fomitopsis serialis]|uniref:uncharacterized protein n=1 Tax=Fomitopsis serialis TaxID=139415 RepID=UPI002007660E|nr:uncharacterized protein B0H18DRAFT_1000945 [Neoantrodia serialis]KAH9928358.1 hypothetical protein B0H18DRAFT_1000945 [Neoantrodia serialis]